MTDSNDLLVRREDGVLVLTFNRPEHRNALTQEMRTPSASTAVGVVYAAIAS